MIESKPSGFRSREARDAWRSGAEIRVRGRTGARLQYVMTNVDPTPAPRTTGGHNARMIHPALHARTAGRTHGARRRARLDWVLLRRSPFLLLFERTFWGLQLLCLGGYIGGAPNVTGEGRRRTRLRRHAARRAVRLDLYVLGWTGIYLTFILLDSFGVHGRALAAIAAILGGYRVFEIVVIDFNIALFEQARRRSRASVLDASRSALLVMWNYVEIIVCFGFLYWSIHVHSRPMGIHPGVNLALQSLRESAELQTGAALDGRTVFGPVVPIVQGLISQALVLVVLTRLLGLLPRFRSLYGVKDGP